MHPLTPADAAKIAGSGYDVTVQSVAGAVNELNVGHTSTNSVSVVSGGSLTLGMATIGGYGSGFTGNLQVNGGTVDASSNFRAGSSANTLGVNAG